MGLPLRSWLELAQLVKIDVNQNASSLLNLKADPVTGADCFHYSVFQSEKYLLSTVCVSGTILDARGIHQENKQNSSDSSYSSGSSTSFSCRQFCM